MGERLKALVTYFLPQDAALAGEALRRHRLMVAFLLITALYALSYVPLCILIEYRSALWSIPLTLFTCIALAFALRRGMAIVPVCNIYLFVLSTQISWLWISTGGLVHSPNDQAFATLFPVIALLLIGRKWAAAWLIYCILLMAAHSIPSMMGHEFEHGMKEEYLMTFALISIVGHAVLLFVFVNIFENSRDHAHKQLELSNAALAREKVKTEELLLNILPQEVAEELKEKGEAGAKSFRSVTILFSDFKDFTSLSEKMSAEELVMELNACFKEFDRITAVHGIEKIKTIGDAYMCAGGMPDTSHGSPAEVVLAGIEMQAFMKRRKAELESVGKPVFEMRVGIHTGPVVAGIVGVKKFQYDIWGDAVNTASRMESAGEAAHVNISEATYLLLKDDERFQFTARGHIAAKGKGDMPMWFVRRSGLAA